MNCEIYKIPRRFYRLNISNEAILPLRDYAFPQSIEHMNSTAIGPLSHDGFRIPFPTNLPLNLSPPPPHPSVPSNYITHLQWPNNLLTHASSNCVRKPQHLDETHPLFLLVEASRTWYHYLRIRVWLFRFEGKGCKTL